VHGEHPGYGDPAALPAGERVDVTQAVLGIGKPERVQALFDALAGLRGGEACGGRPEGDVGADHVLDDLRLGLLEHDAHLAP
jgi:hypothetical protein